MWFLAFLSGLADVLTIPFGWRRKTEKNERERKLFSAFYEDDPEADSGGIDEK